MRTFDSVEEATSYHLRQIKVLKERRADIDKAIAVEVETLEQDVKLLESKIKEAKI